jgi:hypothetical protein
MATLASIIPTRFTLSVAFQSLGRGARVAWRLLPQKQTLADYHPAHRIAVLR